MYPPDFIIFRQFVYSLYIPKISDQISSFFSMKIVVFSMENVVFSMENVVFQTKSLHT